MKKSLRNITINDEYAKLVPDLSLQEYESLKESIRNNGQHIPIIINGQGVLLDGHSRFKVCQELGIEPSTLVRNFENKSYEQLFVIDCNLKRRQLSKFQITELALKAKPLLEEIAKKNESLGGKGVAIKTTLRVDEEIGKRAGVGKDTVRRVEKILKKGSKELQDRARKEETTIYHAYKSVKKAEDQKEIRKLPEGQYDIILADPPGSYRINPNNSLEEHFPGMTKKDISKLRIPSSDNSILFLLATIPKLLESLEVMKAWGFEYKSNIVWIGSYAGSCSYLREKHELLLLGKKGNMLVPDERNRPESVIQTGNNPEDDSTEPTNIYKIIEKMYPNHKYLDLFAGAANSNIDWDKCYDTNGRDILESHYEKISKAIRRFKNDCR